MKAIKNIKTIVLGVFLLSSVGTAIAQTQLSENEVTTKCITDIFK